MPTGYTDGVSSGKVTEFKDYALRCARAFGACIMLRDEPLSSDIPEFIPSEYHDKRLVEANRELQEFNLATPDQRKKMHADEHTKSVMHANEAIARRKEELARYEAMLAKAKSFQPPSPDHQQYAEFLVSQLEESIRFDCDLSFYEKLMQPVPFEEWEKEKIKGLRRDVDYHTAEKRKEADRTASRNKWVEQLKQALDAV